MIELQRAKLGLPPAGATPSLNPSKPTTGGKNIASLSNAASSKQPSPAEVANASLLSEDAQIERFINRLQRRDRRTTTTHHHSNSGPTVPSALSRRMLQRQGVGYLDDTVASVVSASADRFLATVLQQSIACRDQRLKGAAMTREATKQRKRHIEDYDADNDDRKRRKDSIIKAREDIAKFTIEAAESIKKGGSTGSGKATASSTTVKKTKKKKGSKKNAASSAAGGPQKLDPAMEALAMEESEEEYDSIDEEEEYYQENIVGVTRERIKLKKSGVTDEEDEEDEEDSDEEDDTLLLRDIVRPLKAWKFYLNGKEAIETDDDNDEIENYQYVQDGGNSNSNTSVSTTHKDQQAEEKGKSDNDTPSPNANGTEEFKQSSEKKQGDAPANGSKNGAAKKKTASASASSATNHPPSTS